MARHNNDNNDLIVMMHARRNNDERHSAAVDAAIDDTAADAAAADAQRMLQSAIDRLHDTCDPDEAVSHSSFIASTMHACALLDNAIEQIHNARVAALKAEQDAAAARADDSADADDDRWDVYHDTIARVIDALKARQICASLDMSGSIQITHNDRAFYAGTLEPDSTYRVDEISDAGDVINTIKLTTIATACTDVQRIAREIVNAINAIESINAAQRTYAITRRDGKVVEVTIPEHETRAQSEARYYKEQCKRRAQYLREIANALDAIDFDEHAHALYGFEGACVRDVDYNDNHEDLYIEVTAGEFDHYIYIDADTQRFVIQTSSVACKIDNTIETTISANDADDADDVAAQLHALFSAAALIKSFANDRR